MLTEVNLNTFFSYFLKKAEAFSKYSFVKTEKNQASFWDQKRN